jgi:cytochrome P450
VLQDNAANYPRPPFVRDRLRAIVGGGLVGARGRRLAFANSALTSVVDTARLPLPSTRRSERRLALLDSVLYPLIAERWRSPGGEDLVSMLLEVADSETGDGLTDKQVRDETISFFIAGHTIASALTWTWYLLSTHPTVWRKLRANVALCPYVTDRHPGFWDNPEGFEPERFAPEAARARHRMAFFPFSGGPRRCIGEGFALLQLPLVVAMVAQRYRLSLLPARPAEVEAAVTLRPRAPMLMRVDRVA